MNEAARLVGASGAYIRLLNTEELLVAGAATESVVDYLAELIPGLSHGVGASGKALVTKQPVLMPDAAEAEVLTPEARSVVQKYGFHGKVVVPLLANDRPGGTLTVIDTPIRRYSDDEVSLLTAFADQASLALEKARLLNEAQREKERAETEKERSDALYRVSNRLAGVHDTDEVLDLIVNEAARLVGANADFIQLMDGDVLVPGAVTSSAANLVADLAGVQPQLVVEEGKSGAGHVMATKKPLVTEDISQDESITQEGRLLAQKHGFHGGAQVLLLANDRSIGVLSVLDNGIRRFTEDEVSLLAAFADQASLALEKARLLSEAERERERSEALYRLCRSSTSSCS